MITKTKQSSCRQCGACCTKGGPALHGEDLQLIQDRAIPLHDLITIRAGEFAHNPLHDSLRATRHEIVKLKGTGSEWCCCYFDKRSNSCTIYQTRPIACGVLKCWDPEESLKLVEQDLLSRQDILIANGQMVDLVLEYEEQCPLPDFNSLAGDLIGDVQKTISGLEESVNKDLQYRNRVVALSDTVLQEEMFLFGRPLFQILHAFGLSPVAKGTDMGLQVRRQ
jgi:Fe-S-cluster containining protein